MYEEISLCHAMVQYHTIYIPIMRDRLQRVPRLHPAATKEDPRLAITIVHFT